MNIGKIVKECPRALREWILSTTSAKDNFQVVDYKFTFDNEIAIFIKFPNGFEMLVKRHFRELYDYFDSVGIHIEIGIKFPSKRYFANVYNGESIENWSNTISRTETEYLAFEQAFEIRDRQLEEPNS